MKIEAEEFDETVINLDTYNSDLNLVINASKLSAQPLTNEGFAFMWAGARTSHGASKGKFCFEVKILDHLNVSHLPADEPNPHVVRVGFSVESSTLQLGEDPLSYGYGGTGKISTNCQFKDFGTSFACGDVILGVANMDTDQVQIGFAKNGKFLGWAYRVNKYELKGQALFPHVLTKNVGFEVNVGQKDKPYFPLPDAVTDFAFIGCLPMAQRVPGTRCPKRREDCEMIMMCGLPGAGKSVWAADYSIKHPEKKYNVLGTNNIIDKMKVMGLPRKRNYSGRWDVLIQMATKCLNKLFEIGSKQRRNFILDQTNVYPTAQRRKMKNFEGFVRKAVVIVPSDAEYKRRCDKRDREEGKEVPDSAVLEMKANFKLPEVCDIFQEIIYTELQREEATKLVSSYNSEGRDAVGPPKKHFKNDFSPGYGGGSDQGYNRGSPNRGGFDGGSPDSGRGFRGGRGGGFGNNRGGRGGFEGGRGGFDGGRGMFEGGRGGFEGRRGGFEGGRGGRGGFDRGGRGFQGGRGGFGGEDRGGNYEDRGGYGGSRGGGYGDSRGGYGDSRGGYGDSRGGYGGSRGGYSDSRGGYGDRGGYGNSRGRDFDGGQSRGSYGGNGRGYDRNRSGYGGGIKREFEDDSQSYNRSPAGDGAYDYRNQGRGDFQRSAQSNSQDSYYNRDYDSGRNSGRGTESEGGYGGYGDSGAASGRGYRGGYNRGAREGNGAARDFGGSGAASSDYGGGGGGYDRNTSSSGYSQQDYSGGGGASDSYYRRDDGYSSGLQTSFKKEPSSESGGYGAAPRTESTRPGGRASRWSAAEPQTPAYSDASSNAAQQTSTYSYGAQVKSEPASDAQYDSYSATSSYASSYIPPNQSTQGYQNTTQDYGYQTSTGSNSASQPWTASQTSVPAAPRYPEQPQQQQTQPQQQQWSQYYQQPQQQQQQPAQQSQYYNQYYG